MAPAAASPTELIPGYRLLNRLGQGGFGEVWKAEAPGGLLKAVKIVYGTINGGAQSDAPARQELKALERVKAVRHPFILSLERYDIVNGQLIIVTELADKNLSDRFNECRASGLPGIPRDELMRYMKEAAEALDLMNIDHQLQHLDIKPQNLFLVYNHIKVADFGLVKDLEGMRTQVTSGMTAGYAPPETFEGLVSPYCDQYSLAIVYQELLTGRAPFVGVSARQLMMLHLSAEPNLEPLPPEDREAVARALSKRPEGRHASCAAFVRALGKPTSLVVSVSGASAVSSEAPTQPAPPSRDETPADSSASPGVTTMQTGPPRPVEAAKTPGGGFVELTSALPPERPEITGEGLLFPAVVVGVGGVGRETLRCLRKAICKRWGADGLPNVRLVLLDTDSDELQQATEGDNETALQPGGTLVVRLQRPSQYLKPGRERQWLETWLEPEQLCRLPRTQTTPNGWRALGRLAFSANSRTIGERLRGELEVCTDQKVLDQAAKQSGLGLRTNRPRVYIVCGLGGGTGGGMFVDLAYAARRQLQQLGYRQPEVVGLCLLPTVHRSGEKLRSTANTFAALSELAYFGAPGATFSAGYLDQGRPIVETAPPFSRCLLLPLPREDEADSAREQLTLTAEHIVRELATPLARVADAERARRAAATASPRGLVCQTFGAYWFAVPQRLLLRRVAQGACQRLLQSWRGGDNNAWDEAVQAWIMEQLERRHLMPQELAAVLAQQACETLGHKFEEIVEEALAAFAPGQPNDLARNPAGLASATVAMERLVGAPGTDVALVSAPVAEPLRKAGAGCTRRYEEPLGELTFHALAEPRFRLLGMEDRVQDRLCDMMAHQAQAQRAAAEKLAQRAEAIYPQMAQVLGDLNGARFWSRRKKVRAAAELLDLLRRYGNDRWQAMVHQTVSGLYEGLRTHLQKYQQLVNCCRRRIAEFVKGIEERAASAANVDLGLGQYLLPAGCRTLPEAVEQVMAGFTEAEVTEINERVRRLLGRALEEQIHVCTAPANFFKELEEQVLHEVTAFAAAPVGRAHAAERFVEQRGRDDTALHELAAAFTEAAPELAGSGCSPDDELNILAVPPGPEGEHFRALVQRAVPEQTMVPAASTDDIVFYREVLSLPLTALPQMGAAAAEVYRQFLTGDQLTPHSRTDITSWVPPATAPLAT
jgi:serine/threonine protein kinase